MTRFFDVLVILNLIMCLINAFIFPQMLTLSVLYVSIAPVLFATKIIDGMWMFNAVDGNLFRHFHAYARWPITLVEYRKFKNSQ